MEQAPHLKQKYTAKDYERWPDGERWELIDGVAYAMSPSPTRAHQELVGALYRKLADFLDGKPCKPVVAPLDVKLSAHTVVQPDITVWCKRDEGQQYAVESSGSSQLARNGGPEHLRVVIEVLSPSTASYDSIIKRELYEKHGIPEYWVVAPDEKLITRFSLRESRYAPELFSAGEFKSEALSGFALDVEAFFAALGGE